MRLDGAVESVEGIIQAAALSFLFALPLSALVFCAGGKQGKEPTANSKSEKSKTISKSTVSSAGQGATVPADGPAIPDKPPAAIPEKAEEPSDNRPKWAASVLETHTTKTLSKEFVDRLKDYTAPDRSTILFEQNIEKNRYRDMRCFDQDRIILKGPSDYINANYMNAPDGVKYIATQGPLSETRCDFWQMVVQEEAQIVLQLCKFVEGDTEKCAEYWPMAEKETTTVLDKFTIRKLDKPEEVAPGTVKTKLRIESKTVNRTIQHIFCDAWPDQLAPSDTTVIIKIWNYLKANRGSGPIVVHCSAGMGRTATFIGLSYGIEMLKKSGTSMIEVVQEMRKCRPKAVQTHIQYLFLHAVFLELFIQMNLVQRSPAAIEFLDAYKRQIDKKLEKNTDKTGKSPSLGDVDSLIPPHKL